MIEHRLIEQTAHSSSSFDWNKTILYFSSDKFFAYYSRHTAY